MEGMVVCVCCFVELGQGMPPEDLRVGNAILVGDGIASGETREGKDGIASGETREGKGQLGNSFFDSISSLISLMCFGSGDGWVID